MSDQQRLRAAAHRVIAATAADMLAVADAAERAAESRDTQGARWGAASDGNVYADHVQISTGHYGSLWDIGHHVAGWDPAMARTIADWLDDIAERHGPDGYAGDCYPCSYLDPQDCRDLAAALSMCAAWRPEPKAANADA